MTLEEYDKIKSYTYEKYCTYLQNKYGNATCNYFNEEWERNYDISRTKEGLIAHHKKEDRAILLSKIEYAIKYPIEYQKAENIIYCDYLEHLLLHIMICEQSLKNKQSSVVVGIGGIITFLVPELNDYYSGWRPSQTWKQKCLEKVQGNEELYLLLLKRFIDNCKGYPYYTNDCLYKSFNEKFGLWDAKKNKSIYSKIKLLYNGENKL